MTAGVLKGHLRNDFIYNCRYYRLFCKYIGVVLIIMSKIPCEKPGGTISIVAYITTLKYNSLPISGNKIDFKVWAMR